LRSEFENTSNGIAQRLQMELARYEIALSATTGYLTGWSGDPDAFEDFSKLLLSQLPDIYAVGWDALIPDSERDAFERNMRSRGYKDFHITELGKQGNLVPAAKREYYLPVTHILHNAPADSALGFDAASSPVRQMAFARSVRTGKAAATARIEIVGDSQNSSGFLLVQPVYDRHSKKKIRGYAVVVLRINGLIQSIEQKDLRLRLLDRSAPEDLQLLYQSHDSRPAGTDSLQHRVAMSVGQRNWELELTLPASYLVAHRSWQAWIVLAAGLLLTALLGILLLVIVGRTTKVEQIVAERTAALQDSEKRFRDLLESAPDAMIIVRQDGTMDLINSQAEKLFGYERRELIGKPIEHLIPQRLRDSHMGHRDRFFKQPHTRPMGVGLELHGLRKDGSEFPIEISLSPLKSGARNTVTATIRDVTERKQAESYVRHLAHHDVLTNLPNRILLHERLADAMGRAEKIGTQLALMMVDLDHFKRVNDSLGHHIGDELLVAIVERLLKSVRQTDTVARMGGDEFVILLPNVTDLSIIEKIASTLQQQIEKPVVVGGRELVLTSSIGITVYPRDGNDVATLLKNADTAMYRAKDRGRNNFQWFKPDMLQAAEEKLEMENALRRALERHEFTMHYQPLVSVDSGRLVGVEALLRWQHPTLGAVEPETFIALAEDTGLIVPIGEWALMTSCTQAKELQVRLGRPINVAVNLSPRQLRQNNIQKTIEKALLESSLDPRCLILEITETALISNPVETAEALKNIQAMGVAIALDDFGTGYSSLNYITRYPIDKIKIDRSFVHDLGQDSNDTAIINAIIAMSHSLGIKVVAEGVETLAQLQHLKAHGCDEAQGFYFGPPTQADQIRNINYGTDVAASNSAI
jgi:diguanylate cyclase (GGDEF)-like protein/PAS domain S-box-containing protein